MPTIFTTTLGLKKKQLLSNSRLFHMAGVICANQKNFNTITLTCKNLEMGFKCSKVN